MAHATLNVTASPTSSVKPIKTLIMSDYIGDAIIHWFASTRVLSVRRSKPAARTRRENGRGGRETVDDQSHEFGQV